MKITLSVIKADIGGYVGHSCTHPDVVKTTEEYARKFIGDLIIDLKVLTCGDDIALVMT
ncbi:MAG: fructose 1,6-bisphosphatase, partial [Hydrogenobaculum sp.]